MEQLPDVVMALLLIGVDMYTTTELRRDILHSISLLCHRLPAEPVDGIVRCNPWFRRRYDPLIAFRRSLWPRRCWIFRGPSQPWTRRCYCHFSLKAALAAFVSLGQLPIMFSLAQLFHL
jgi:hypothetical protein